MLFAGAGKNLCKTTVKRYFANMRETSTPKAHVAAILKRLAARYPAPRSQLNAESPWEILVSTVLAAQCTDARVNLVTPHLFARWPGPAELAEAGAAELEEVIRSTGLFRSKAKHLIAAAQIIAREHGGKVPDNMAELVRLPGVARKTANIILWSGYGRNEGVAVDTHVKRISFRLGLTASDRPEVIEKDLMRLFPRDSWGDLNHRLVWFGREVCMARNPQCESCELADLCPRSGQHPVTARTF